MSLASVVVVVVVIDLCAGPHVVAADSDVISDVIDDVISDVIGSDSSGDTYSVHLLETLLNSYLCKKRVTTRDKLDGSDVKLKVSTVWQGRL